MITIDIQAAPALRTHGSAGTWREHVRPSVLDTTGVVLAGRTGRNDSTDHNSIAATAAVSAYVTDGPATDAKAAAMAKPAAPPRGAPR